MSVCHVLEPQPILGPQISVAPSYVKMIFVSGSACARARVYFGISRFLQALISHPVMGKQQLWLCLDATST